MMVECIAILSGEGREGERNESWTARSERSSEREKKVIRKVGRLLFSVVFPTAVSSLSNLETKSIQLPFSSQG